MTQRPIYANRSFLIYLPGWGNGTTFVLISLNDLNAVQKYFRTDFYIVMIFEK